MALIAAGKFISIEISSLMQGYLEGVPEHWPLQFFFSRYGAKVGLTVGVNTMASTISKKDLAHAGKLFNKFSQND